MNLTYPSFILKLSGEALGEPEKGGISAPAAAPVIEEVLAAHKLGARIGIVVGAGNLWRGAGPRAESFNRTRAHQIGLLGTIMNAVALGEMLSLAGLKSRVYSALSVREIVPELNIPEARKAMEQGETVLFAGGTGNPYFTTDSAAALRAIQMSASAVFKATTVDGVYSADPKKDPNAVRYETLSFDEALAKGLKVMDATAFDLCRENRVPIVVFCMKEKGAMARLVKGEKLGTLVK